MNILRQAFRSNIGNKILINILLCSSLLTLIFTAYKLHQDYLNDINFINKELNSIQNYSEDILERSLWIIDDTTIDTLINATSQQPYIAYVAILDVDGTLLNESGKKPDAARPDREVSLFHRHEEEKPQKLGTLEIYTDFNPVYHELKNRFFITLYTQLAKTFITSLFIILLIYYSIVRHIIEIVNFFSKNGSNSPETLSLKIDHPDNELKKLVDILNRYKKRTDQKYLDDIKYNATHDYLTGAYNRYHFDKKFHEILHNTEEPALTHVIGVLDLDSFKKINDLFGHAKGDEVLIHTARTLREHFGQDELIARQGGDEFVFVVPLTLEEAQQKSIRMLKAMGANTFYHNEHAFHISASVGISAINLDNDTVSTAISKADKGCYLIKSNGGGSVEVVENQLASQQVEAQLYDYRMVDIFRSSLAAGSLRLYAQIIVPLQLHSKLPVGIEILTRMIYKNELIMPDRFIPSLEHGHSIYLLDRYVINKMIYYIKSDFLKEKYISINLSPYSFNDQETQESALQLLKSAAEKGIHITFEITENVLISHPQRINQVAKIIRDNGGSIAIDDFGKGHASYSYIEQFDIDVIKIDASLVERINDPKIHAIIASIQSIAHSIGAVTVAEHVNNELQKQQLRDIGIDYTQSFLDGKPYPLPESKDIILI